MLNACWSMLDSLICTCIMPCFMHALGLTYCFLRIWSLLMAQSPHLLNGLRDPSLWSAISEYLDVPVLLKSGQSQWMASLKITKRAHREELGEYTLDFPQPSKDCYSMSHLPGRLSFLVMSFVMKPLSPLWLRLGDHSMML